MKTRRRRMSTARIKANRTYDVLEAAELVGVSPQTVRSWPQQGLPIMRSQRPYLILGSALKAFLETRAADRKRPLKVGEMFCLRCKTGTRPALGMVQYHPLSDRHGRLEGFCSCCEGPVGRIVSAAALPAWAADHDIAGNISPQA